MNNKEESKEQRAGSREQGPEGNVECNFRFSGIPCQRKWKYGAYRTFRFAELDAMLLGSYKSYRSFVAE
ncbi:MAG: hypothetical protein GXY51_10945 [Bacteroidetes bacterium]|jgi:hypothetical protein|nr:hypothetical protein [Bacteroidota bacterium]